MIHNLKRIFTETFTYNAFITKNGYKHLILFFTIAYGLFMWLGTPKTDGSALESSMPYIAIMVIGVVFGYIAERIAQRLTSAPVSATDVIWYTIGALLALAIYNILGGVVVLLIVFSVISLFIIFLTFKK